MNVRLSRSAVCAFVVLVTVGAPAVAHAATAKPTLLGLATLPVVSDGRSMVAFGVGPDARISRDDSTAPRSLGLSDGCSVAAAYAGTGVLGCGDDKPFRLISLRTGVTRPLPGAEQLTPPGSSSSVGEMGSQWLSGIRTNGPYDSVALQWHTGETRLPLDSTWYLPTTILSSPNLRLPKNDPYVQAHGALIYHRGRFKRSLGIKSGPPNAHAEIRVSGWRVAWVTNQGKGGPFNAVVVLNAKTGRRITIPLRRFVAPGYPIGASGYGVLRLTDKRLVLVYRPAGAVPGSEGVITSLPWPSEVRRP